MKSTEEITSRTPESPIESAAAAVQRTCRWLGERQHSDGYWCGELEGDTILESEYILLLAWLGREDSSIALKAARYILDQQLPDGGWAMYPGGSIDISGSVKAYFALKLTGHDPQADYMQRACRAIRTHGGADAVNSFTRFYLALLGQISYEHCPAVPPEAMLLPAWSPVSIYQISAWSRTILVPLAIMWAHRPVCELPPHLGIEELFLQRPENWPELRCPGVEPARGLITWDRTFRLLDRALKWCERWRLKPLRRWALKSAQRWMLDRFEDSDGLGAIFPPIIWSVVALKCLGYDEDSEEIRYCFDHLDRLTIEEETMARLEPCKSPVWDTAITLRALSAAGSNVREPTNIQAIDWLLEKEVSRRGDWATKVNCEPAGWFFEHHNDFYPDVDDTIMVMMALAEQMSEPRASGSSDRIATDPIFLFQNKAQGVVQAKQQVSRIDRAASACQRGLRWVLAMQNRDGGWGAFDRDNDHEFLCHVPFADHNAMIDPSTADITARVLECFARFGMSASDNNRAIDRALRFVRDSQEEDGSWPGRWGVNYIYGTWQVLVGLADIGVPTDDSALQRGAQWLLQMQQPCGGWGESPDSYEDPSLRGQGPPTASQTAWALLGLMAVGLHNHPAVERGIGYLTETQRDDGGWDEPQFTGTGFPRVFYLRYHMYPIYFPLLAISQWKSSTDSILTTNET